jgi:radical SAM protein with 4Fe4S-binding SPASM domain
MTDQSAIRQAKSRVFILQVHVTNRCNLRCAHCYQDNSPSNEMGLDQILGAVNQFHRLCCLHEFVGQLTLTGGEPFVRADFFSLLEEVTGRYPSLRVAILTNGTLLTESTVQRLARFHPVFVQVSVDGSERTHDEIRGRASYSRALRGLKCLQAKGIYTLVSFTAHRHNFRDFPLVVEAARQVGAKRVWADRLVPLGKGEYLQPLTPDQTQEFFNIVHEEQLICARQKPVTTHVDMRRSLQFLIAGGRPYRCAAGRRLLAVMPDGLVYPCRRLPIPIANVLSTSLVDIYQNARQVVRKHTPCNFCQYAKTCSGGSRCLGYAATGDLMSPDPGCWLV